VFYRIEGWQQTPTGEAVAGADVAILGQPADTTTEPGSPLEQLYAEPSSNSATVTAAVWAGQQIEFTLNAVPADVVPGSFLALSGALPSAFNTTLQEPYLVIEVDGLVVTVVAEVNPGTWISGGTFATSVLPNPLQTDGNGYYFAYLPPGLYTVQIYSPIIPGFVYPDQPVGTVAGGSVLSVGLALPAEFTVSGSPVTTTGTLTAAWANESANSVFAGPSAGSPGTPGFRALVAADLPAITGVVTSVGFTLSVPNIFSGTVTGSPITSSGTIAAGFTLATQAANTFWRGPTSGAAAAPAFGPLVVADIPPTGYTSLASALFEGAQQDSVDTLTGATDAILFPGSVFINTAGIDACTLATPTTPGDDGMLLTIFDESGHAHTVTTAANKIAPAHSLITFNGTVGSFCQLEAKGGLWWPRANSGVVIS
jgi:hypothetical protein